MTMTETERYRRRACHFLASIRQCPSSTSNKAELLGHVEQNIGQRALLYDGILDSKPISTGRTGPTANERDSRNDDGNGVGNFSSNLDFTISPLRVHCHCCGGWLIPGKNGTRVRLRSVGRGRTRRRRASRRKAASMKARKQAGNTSNLSAQSFAIGQQRQQEKQQQQELDAYCTTDGQCRNKIVYRCALCDADVVTANAAINRTRPPIGLERKGLPPKKQKQYQSRAEAPIRGTNPSSSSTLSSLKRTADSEDLLRLSTSRKPTERPTHLSQHLQIQPKKKKQRKKKQSTSGNKPNNLMSFLSTLND